MNAAVEIILITARRCFVPARSYDNFTKSLFRTTRRKFEMSVFVLIYYHYDNTANLRNSNALSSYTGFAVHAVFNIIL